MRVTAPQHKVERTTKHGDVSLRRQPIRLGARQVGHQPQFHPTYMRRMQKADATRLDHAGKTGGRRGDHILPLTPHLNLVIGDQRGPRCHHTQREAGFAAA